MRGPGFRVVSVTLLSIRQEIGTCIASGAVGCHGSPGYVLTRNAKDTIQPAVDSVIMCTKYVNNNHILYVNM